MLLVPVAQAYTILCTGLEPSGAVPGLGAADVPVDARPAVVFEAGCSSTAAWDASLLRLDDGSAVPFSLGAGSDDLDATMLMEVFPDSELTPEVTYELTLASALLNTTTIEFTAGSSRIVGLDGDPTLDAAVSDWDGRNSEISVSLDLTPAADPDGLSVIQVQDASVDRGIRSFLATDHVDFTWSDSSKPGELCLQVRQIDGAGVATDWSDADCAPVPMCGTTGAGGAVGTLLAVLLLTARRR